MESGSRDAKSKLGDLLRLSRYGKAVVGLMLVGLVLRVCGVHFGLPQLYYWDEPTVVNRAMRFGTGDLNPHYFYYPALYMYVLFVATGVFFVGGKLSGAYSGAQDFARTYFTAPTGVYTAVRVTTALVGVLAIWAAYQLGKRYFNQRVGLIAALLVAVSPLHVSHSHVAITDIPHALLICLATLVCHSVLTRGRPRDYALAGLLIGLGAATKYLAIFNCVTLVVAHVLHDDSWHTPRLQVAALIKRALLSPLIWLGAAATLFGFVIGTPYNFINFGDFIADFRSQASLSAGDAGQGFLLVRSTLADFGWPACALALYGLFSMLRRPSKSTWVLLCFSFVYGLEMLNISKSFSRYLLPQTAFIAVTAAFGLDELAKLIGRRLGEANEKRAFALLAVVSAAWPLALSITWDHMQVTGVDTRTQALQFAERELPAGSVVTLQSLYNRTFDNVPLVTDQTLARLERVLPSGGSMGAVRESVLENWRARHVFRELSWSEEPAPLEQGRVRYVWLTDVYGDPTPAVKAWLASSGKLVRRFEPNVPLLFRPLAESGRELLPVMPPILTLYEIQR